MVSILSHIYYCVLWGEGNTFWFALCLESSLKAQTVYAIKKFVFVRFDLLINLHDQKEYDNYFIISREANMFATLKIKIEIITH